MVGLGGWGSAALWQLARRGVDVVGFDRFEPGHGFGSSHGGSRMFRITCLEHPGLVPLARRSWELWTELEATAAVPLLDRCGGLLIGPPEGHIVGGTLRSAQEHEIEVERLDAVALRHAFPQHAGVPSDHIGVWEASAGLVRPEEAIRAAVGLAIRSGAHVYTDTRVTGLKLVAEGAVLHTAARDFRVHQVIVTVGPWTSTLVPGLPLETVRMPITWFRPVASAKEFALKRFPVFMRECADNLVLWGNGRHNGYEVKLGLEYTDGMQLPPIDPEQYDRSTCVADWSRLSAVLTEKVPGLEPVPARVSVCMATQTPDGQFMLGRPGGDHRLIVAGGCNAHGFKHATGIGETLTQLALGETPTIPLEFTDPDRFRKTRA